MKLVDTLINGFLALIFSSIISAILGLSMDTGVIVYFVLVVYFTQLDLRDAVAEKKNNKVENALRSVVAQFGGFHGASMDEAKKVVKDLDRK